MVRTRNLHPGINLGSTDPETHRAAEGIVFGFWLFLMADLVIFGALFATYAAMSVQGIAQGPTPADVFDLGSAFLETMLLLGSSFAFGFATLEMKYRANVSRLHLWLAVAGLLGAAFVAMELRDYYIMATVHGATPSTSGFLSAYYLLTGTHVAHVTAGLVWMLVMMVQISVFGVSGAVKLRLLRLGLFWHMLDVVWVGIFTFVYLFGVVS
ncbi:cytochrome o ubiquinol oxidase subunit III [Aureimonas fodinaquatilis]|uniref:Cytochrome bo(3) ubiquinol oxidase subunit 3 n=2 Tax=Aureimonas fodinaquatilis TaxID=2565783 RepID=A0A5B0DSZ9_9HYPH|nr:cytochrome o ubiquinol oxidase subunit III [Aureimonas fodinaquatilis]